jgi:ribosome-associated protein
MTNKESARTREVVIKTEIVDLCDLLKFENLAQSGGEAKFVIAEGRVRVNGEVETRKRKKLRAGDVVEYAGQTLRLVATNVTGATE